MNCSIVDIYLYKLNGGRDAYDCAYMKIPLHFMSGRLASRQNSATVRALLKMFLTIYKKTNTIFERILICLYIKVPYNCKPTERETAFNNARM